MHTFQINMRDTNFISSFVFCHFWRRKWDETLKTYVKPFETDCDRFIDIRFSIKYITYESPLKKNLQYLSSYNSAHKVYQKKIIPVPGAPFPWIPKSFSGLPLNSDSIAFTVPSISLTSSCLIFFNSKMKFWKKGQLC